MHVYFTKIYIFSLKNLDSKFLLHIIKAICTIRSHTFFEVFTNNLDFTEIAWNVSDLFLFCLIKKSIVKHIWLIYRKESPFWIVNYLYSFKLLPIYTNVYILYHTHTWKYQACYLSVSSAMSELSE